MDTFVYILDQIGAHTLEVFWLPVFIWTILALLVIGSMKVYDQNISAACQYYNRVALLWAIATGVIGSVVIKYLTANSAGEILNTPGFIVVQNPITVTAEAASSVIDWNEPVLWTGIATILTGLIATALLKLMVDFVWLYLLSKTLSS